MSAIASQFRTCANSSLARQLRAGDLGVDVDGTPRITGVDMKQFVTVCGIALALSAGMARPAAAATILFSNAPGDIGGTMTFNGAAGGQALITNGAIDNVIRLAPTIGITLSMAPLTT